MNEIDVRKWMIPGWLRVRRHRVRGCKRPPWAQIALHELANALAVERPQRAAARETPRRQALAGREGFAGSGRWLYRPIHHATAPRAQAA